MSVAQMPGTLRYKEGYKYQVWDEISFLTDIFPGRFIETPFIDMGLDGVVTIKAGYAWDGPSGPAIDTPNFMRGSLLHDALYQLMRQKHLSSTRHRAKADALLRDVCRADGMSKLRSKWVYWAVRNFAARSSVGERPVLEAP